MKDGGYAGKIKNGGTQVVQAPKQTTDQKKGTVKKGGDRQELHEKLRQHSIAAAAQVKEEGKPNDLIDRVVNDASFGLTHADIAGVLVPEHFTGRSAQQVEEFLDEVIRPVLEENKDLLGIKAEINV